VPETFVDDVEEGTVDEVVEVLSINFRLQILNNLCRGESNTRLRPSTVPPTHSRSFDSFLRGPGSNACGPVQTAPSK
jgi:hypothetical protein